MIIDLKYDVIVRPLNTIQLYTIGSTVRFNCNITPNPLSIDPTVRLRYYWYFSGSSRPARVSSLSNTSIYIHQGYSKVSKILCEVRGNNVPLNYGHYLMEVEGNHYRHKIRMFNNVTFFYRCSENRFED